MRPLLANELSSFLERFGNFVDGELRDVETISPTLLKVTLAGQDSARAFDWITVEFEFTDVIDARLIDNNKLIHVDMSDGIKIIHEYDKFIFEVQNSTFQISCKSIKYQEGQF